MTNTRIPDPEPGSLKVTKVVEWGVTTPDTNQRFRICITGPTYPSSSCISSDYDGVVVTWLLLEPGDYTVTEIDPGADWQVSGSGQVVVVAAGQSASATITNTRIP